MRLCFVVNNPEFLVSHRLVLALGARDAGHDVHVIAPRGPGAEVLEGKGFSFHEWRLDRGGQALASEAVAVARLVALYRQVRPDVVHHVTIKPVLYGSLAAAATGVRGVVNAVSGLGYVFMAQGRRAAVRRALVARAYRMALARPNSAVILQNDDDEADLRAAGALAAARVVKIRGSGVDIDAFPVTDEPTGSLPVVVCPARLLRDKGVHEFVEAARILKGQARFALVGSIDVKNPTAVKEALVRQWETERLVEWWGHRHDMATVFQQATLVALPSYREGLPKALLEAGASGRAVVTTDAPGCRDVVDFGRLGPLVPVGNGPALARAIAALLGDSATRDRLRHSLAAHVRTHFDQRLVLHRHLEVWASVG
jgi:glycosyltransferase involved in cell wall biosynthesis